MAAVTRVPLFNSERHSERGMLPGSRQTVEVFLLLDYYEDPLDSVSEPTDDELREIADAAESE